ncbi:MAG: MBL fold metallo-hydrolase [Symbiobacterium sp.]|uniref:MBL fold metallo-hydrolase n=1 Tax=Symbiobacterium sp. TaxID=1971213 RepID=UPI003464D457
MRQLSESLFLHQDTCNVYVIKDGRAAVLVDFGDGSVLDELGAVGVDRVTDVLMTHHHRDQGQGLRRAVEAGVRIWVPEAEQDLFARVDRHWQARELSNIYNTREDRFSLLEPVPLAGLLRDYREQRFGRHVFTVVPTPGHTTGSVSLLAEIDGRRVAFTGDLLYGPGKVWSLAATQWTYNGGEGIPGTILSLLDLKARRPDVLLPSHGEPMLDPAGAIDPTVERLADLRTVRRHNPRLFLLREHPYEPAVPETPHLLFNRTSMANSFVLRSESGKGLVIDFGYDFMFGPAAGADRASRRPWLYTIPVLKEKYGVRTIDVVIPTHYHDDHVAGINLLREVEAAQHWCPETFAHILERPEQQDLPCLWYDAIPVDRRLPLGEPVRWEEYTLTLYPLSGHTAYAVAIAFEVDGMRVLAVGDQLADEDGLFLNYVYKNRWDTDDFVQTVELLRRLRPDVLIRGHWGPLRVTEEYLDKLERAAREVARLHRELLPLEEVDFGTGSFGADIHPYRATLRPGERLRVTVVVRNPFGSDAEATVRLALPEGWRAEPEVGRVRLSPRTAGEVAFTVQAPPGGSVYRARIAADLTVGGRRFGQHAEALYTVEGERS